MPKGGVEELSIKEQGWKCRTDQEGMDKAGNRLQIISAFGELMMTHADQQMNSTGELKSWHVYEAVSKASGYALRNRMKKAIHVYAKEQKRNAANNYAHESMETLRDNCGGNRTHIL